MSRTLLCFILLLSLFTTCCVVPHQVYPTPVVQIKSETVGLVAMVETNDGVIAHNYCAGVWVDNSNVDHAKSNTAYILTAKHCAVAAMILSLSPDMREKFADIIEETVSPVGVAILYTTEGDVRGMWEAPRNTHPGKVVAVDNDHDLALIAVDKQISWHRSVKVAHNVEAGDSVMICGHPRGALFSIMTGNIAAIRGDIGPIVKLMNVHGPFIQVFSGITKGNSGGGVFDTNGELVGIVSFGLNDVNEGYAIHLISIRGFLGSALKTSKCSDNSCQAH